MDVRTMSTDELISRRNELAEALDSAPAEELDNIEAEARAIREELETRAAEEKKRNEIRAGINDGSIPTNTIERGSEVNTEKTIKEIRNSQEYINAYAEYVKGGYQDDTQLRALLTEDVTGGTLPIPDFVDEIIRTAWDDNSIMSEVYRADMEGDFEVGFEYASSDAADLPEGTSTALTEGTISTGIVTIKPDYIAKWTTISRRAMKMKGERFLRYIYDSLAHKLVKKAADKLVGAIAGMPQTATASAPSAAKITEAPGLATIAHAIANLSDEAENPVVIMNKLTEAAFEDVRVAANFAQDPFKGLTVKHNNSLPAYSAATAGAVYAIVGDLKQGAVANFPEGEGIEYLFDEMTQKKVGMIEVQGMQLVGIGVVSCGAFTLICKPSAG